MAWGNRRSDQTFQQLSPLVALVTVAASLFALSGTAGAALPVSLSSVSGRAFGEHVDVQPFGGSVVSGPLPAVTLPATGGNVSASQASVIVPPGGPATGVFLTATGPLTAHSEGAIGTGGFATSTASVAGVSSIGLFKSASVASSCRTADGFQVSTTLAAGSTLKVSKDQTIDLPTNPAPNTTYQGVDNSADGSGDTFTVILNEEMITSNQPGTINIDVNAVHIILHGPTATGDIFIAGSHCDSTKVAAPIPCTTVTGTVTGPVVVQSGKNLCFVNATVSGGITVQPGGQLSVTNSVVRGGIKSNGAVSFRLCGSVVYAPPTGPALSVSGTTGPVRVGDPSTNCPGNRVAGNVTVTGNSGGVVFGNNAVDGNATFTGNTGGPIVIKSNYISGALACSTNSPAPDNAGQPNTAASKTRQCIGV